MLSFFFPQHPLEKTDTKVRDLVVIVNKLLRSRDQFSRSRPFSDSFQRLDSRIRGLQTTVRTEAEGWSVFGATSRQGTRQIKARFSRFQAALRELDQKLAPADGRTARKLVDNVERAARAVRLAIARLGKAVDSGSVKVVRIHGRYLEEFIKVREFMFTLDKKVAEELTGPEVDSWCHWPGMDIENPHQVLRLAKLIRLSKLPGQVFSLSVQSAAPGRPLKPMTRLTRFPTEKDLRVLGRKMGGPVKIYVVASKPRWRKVWTFEPDDVAWWD